MRRYHLESLRSVFSRQYLLLALLLGGLVLFLVYMGWTSRIARKTLLIKSFPDFTIYLTCAGVVGLAFAARAVYYRPVGKTVKYVGEMFMMGATIGFVLPLNCFDVYVYLFPDKTIRYITDYEVTIPGPSRYKSTRCEAGIWVKELYTARWLHLCSTEEEVRLGRQRQAGMDGLWVTARVNKLGAYIEHYQFGYKPLSAVKPGKGGYRVPPVTPPPLRERFPPPTVTTGYSYGVAD